LFARRLHPLIFGICNALQLAKSTRTELNQYDRQWMAFLPTQHRRSAPESLIPRCPQLGLLQLEHPRDQSLYGCWEASNGMNKICTDWRRFLDLGNLLCERQPCRHGGSFRGFKKLGHASHNHNRVDA
jgi:hypothetical protein